jgi:hypothetical protein
MKNSFKIATLALAIIATVIACNPPKGTTTEKVDSLKKDSTITVDTAKKDTTTVTTTVKKDSIKK